MSENEKKVDQGLLIAHPQRIVNIHGLAEYLKATCSNLRRFWRDYPHFFVGTGTDLKAARFDVADVLTYLKMNKGVGYELVPKPKEGKLVVRVRAPRQRGTGTDRDLSLTLLGRNSPRLARILEKRKDESLHDGYKSLSPRPKPRKR